MDMKSIKRVRRTADTVLQEFREVHGDKFTYDMSGYENLQSKIPTKCKVKSHEEFYPSAKNHLNGSGCMKCYNDATSKRQKGVKRKGIGGRKAESSEMFFTRMTELHDGVYDYTGAVYVNARTKIKFRCPNKDHKPVVMLPSAHAQGQGCKECAVDKRRKPKPVRPDGWVGATTKWSTERFVTYCTVVHDGKYTYPNTVYVNDNTEVLINCPIHGEFLQLPKVHKKGHGCKACAVEESIERMRNTAEENIAECNRVHNNAYTYNFSGAETSHDTFEAICPEHGSWYPTIVNHVSNKSGCPKCAKLDSKAQREIYDYVKTMRPDAEYDDNTIIKPKQLDIVVPSLKLAIEYCGLRFHGVVYAKKHPRYHSNKTDACNDLGYRLITIFENEWLDSPEIVKERISYILGYGARGYGARTTQIQKIDFATARDFMKMHHLQGSTTQMPDAYGAYKGDDLIAVMAFSKPRVFMGRSDGYPELVRFATDGRNHSGIASKLFKHYITTTNPAGIISYSDRRWSNGNLYKALGFGYSHTSKPNYQYFKGKKTFHRYTFQKKKLIAKYDADPNLTEWEIMVSMGYDKIYDCGSDVWVWESQRPAPKEAGLSSPSSSE